MTTMKEHHIAKLERETKRQCYQEKAEAAAQCERLGNYQQAADLWNLAAKYAGNTVNQQWCNSRCEFCERMLERPF